MVKPLSYACHNKKYLPKKPAAGGTPAIENKTSVKTQLNFQL